jgi:hypothetical protein
MQIGHGGDALVPNTRFRSFGSPSHVKSKAFTFWTLVKQQINDMKPIE